MAAPKNKTNKIRTFQGGATRDTEEGKPDYFGFTSALVLKRFGDYMNLHRVQPDGKLRAGNNWKLGIDPDSYIRSLNRHMVDLNLHMEGFGSEAREDKETALSAIMFNAQGLLFEILKNK